MRFAFELKLVHVHIAVKLEETLKTVSGVEVAAPAVEPDVVARPEVRSPIFREIPAKPGSELPPEGTLGRGFKNRYNNLLIVRLFLSLTVVFSHSFALANGPVPGDWLKRHLTEYWGHPGITIGFSAVNMFFVVSGFLVTHSFLRSKSVVDFAKKRAWRIYPPYIIASLMCLLIIGPLALHHWPARPYSEWPKYFLDVAMLRIYDIPGIFADHPYKINGNGVLNGSMWTIKYEVMCYVFIVLTWSVGMLQRKWPVALAFGAIATYYGLQVSGLLEQWHLTPWLPRAGAYLFGEAREWPRMLTCYLAGMTLYLYRDSLPHKFWAASLAILLLIGAGAVNSWLLLPLHPLLLGYALLCFGFTTVGRQYTSKIDRFDLSYGVYLYAFPIQQTIIHFIPAVRGNPLLLFSLAYPTVLTVAYLSMRFIEQRFQMKKSAPGAAPAVA